ncbi:hypothetical protein D3C87_1635700 [compost metagenome]
MLLELGCERSMAGIIFGGHNQSGGVFINTVHNPRTNLAVNAGQVLAMIHQRIDQCAGRMADCRMNHHPARFIYNNNIAVFIDHFKRNILRNQVCCFSFRHGNCNHIAFGQLIVGFYRSAVYGYMSSADPQLYLGA